MVQVDKVHTYTGHKDSIYTLEHGMVENLFFSAGGDGHVIQWDLNNFQSGRVIAKVPTSVYALHLIKSSNQLVIGQNYEGIHIIDLAGMKEAASLKLGSAAIFDIKSTDRYLLIALAGGEFVVVDINTLTIVKRWFVSDLNLRDILVSNNSSCLIASSEGNIIEIDLEKLEMVHQFEAHDNSVFSLMNHPSDNVLISTGRDAKIKFWSEKQLIESVNAHMYAINDLVFKAGANYFASASMDKTIKIWDYQKRKLLKVIDKARHQGHLTSVNKLLWTQHNDYLISCSDDRSIGVWDIQLN